MRCERGGRGSRRPRWDRRTRQSATILDRIVSQVTITDPHHFLFGNRLPVLTGRSGRGPAYVVVELPDGRRRSVRIASTDAAEATLTSSPKGPDLPRISVRTLIPLMQHLDANLSLLAEEVIRDGHTSPSTSRCVSTSVDSGTLIGPAGNEACEPMAELVSRDTKTDRPDDGRADPTDADDRRYCRKGDGSC